MTKTEKAVSWIKQIAADNSHGYLYGGWGPDYDCGHLVIDAWEHAGVPVKEAGATFTGNMRRSFLKCGFRDVTDQVNLKNGAGIKAGDVLLNEKNHAAMCIGNGKIVQARTNLDGKAGDSSGNEIREQAYYNYPWDCVLRYEGDDSGSKDEVVVEPPKETPTTSGGDNESTSSSNCDVKLPVLRKGDRGEVVRAAQILLRGRDCSVGIWGADGDFGNGTESGVLAFQRRNKLDADGIIGPRTWDALLGL